MTIRQEHILYTDEQVANRIMFLLADDDPEGPHLAVHPETKQLAVFVRKSFQAEDEQKLLLELDVIRFDWLRVLGYDK